MLDAIKFAHEEIKKHCAAQIELSKELGKDVKRVYCHETNDEELRRQVIEATYDKAYEIAKAMTSKHERMDRFDALEAEFEARFQRRRARREENADQALFHDDVLKKAMRNMISTRGIRLDGRHGRNSPDLVRDRLSAGSSRFGDFPGAKRSRDDRNARHENGRKSRSTTCWFRNRFVRRACTITSPRSPTSRRVPRAGSRREIGHGTWLGARSSRWFPSERRTICRSRGIGHSRVERLVVDGHRLPARTGADGCRRKAPRSLFRA